MNDLTRILKNAGLNKPLTESTKPSNEKVEENEVIIVDESLEEYSPENYTKKLEQFIKETAGVGVNAEFNTWPYTPDIKKGTLKKTGEQMGFDITDAGIPPNVSKDSGVKSKKQKK